ncbi:MAG: methyltransferase domain-containing protein [Actinobacteria bacterium]|nr:MAG: methyltransferase domain-containing protein [Actinomycetota bacterium]
MVNNRPEHPTTHRVGHLLALRQLAGMARHLWSSDVNLAAVELLEPRSGENILDLGAGLGPATYELARHVGTTGQVFAVDPSRLMRAVLRVRRLTQPNQTSVSIEAGSGENLPLPTDSIDAAIALNVMHHLENLNQTASELARVLRPTARLLLIDEDFGHKDHTFGTASGNQHRGPQFVDPTEMANSLTDAGFIDISHQHTEIGGEPSFLVAATRRGSE